jgi:hypothetical protein
LVFTGYDLIEEAIKKKCLTPVKKMIREQKIPWLQTNILNAGKNASKFS